MLKTLTGSTASNGEGQPGQPGQPDQPIDTIDITTALSQLLPHQAAVIRKLVTDGHYTLAIQYAGCRRDCQKALVAAFLKQRRISRPTLLKLAKQWSLTDDSRLRDRLDTYYPVEVEHGRKPHMTLPANFPCNVIRTTEGAGAALRELVEELTSTAAAHELSSGVPPAVVGIDVEWRPVFDDATKPVASILQIASRKRVLILDLKTLLGPHRCRTTPEVFELLRKIWLSDTIFKVGTDFQHDLHILHRSYPDIGAFLQINKYLDMTCLDRVHYSAMCADEVPSSVHSITSGTVTPSSDGNGAAKLTDSNDSSCYKEKVYQGKPYQKKIAKRIAKQRKRKQARQSTGKSAAPRPRGLAAIVKGILGKLLDKQEQVSDWGQRPLTSSQIAYAAVDAFCQVASFDRVLEIVRGHGASAPFDPPSSTLVSRPIVTIDPAKDGSISSAPVSEKSVTENLIESPNGPTDVQTVLDSNTSTITPAVFRVGAAGLGRRNFVNVEFDFEQHEPNRVEPPLECSGKQAETMCLLKNIAIVGSEGHLFLVIMRNADRVDFRLLAHAVEQPRKKLRMATAEECRDIFGYCPGSVPPIALLAKNVQVIIDSVVAKEGEPRSSAKQRFSHRVRLSPSTPGRHREVGAATPGQRRFVCGAGHPQLVFIASLDQLQQLTGPSTLIANVSNMKQLFEAEAGAALENDNLEVVLAARPRFFADSMMSRLGRWMRALGVDVEIWDGERNFFAIALAALQQKRILLTRDYGLSVWRDAQAVFFLPSNSTKEALAIIIEHFGISFDSESFLSRCGKCNGSRLAMIDKRELKDDPRVAPKVYARVEEFWECTQCQHVYWEGPKFFEAREMFESLCGTDGTLKS